MKTKKVILTSFIIIAIVTLFAVTSYAATTGVVNTVSDPLRMRSGPSTADSLVISVPKGTVVTILNTVACTNNDTNNPTWYYVTCTVNNSQYSGYVSAKYISDITDTGSGSGGGTGGGTSLTEVPEIYKSYLTQLMALHPNWIFKFYDTGLDWTDVMTNETKVGKNAISSSQPISYRSTTVNYTAGSWTCVINGSDGKLNVRSKPSSNGDSTIIGAIENGEIVNILSKSGSWYLIECSLGGGYVYSGLVKDVQGVDPYTPVEGTSWYQPHGQVVSYYMDPRNFMSENLIFQFEELGFDSTYHTLSGVEKIIQNTFMAGQTIVTDDNRTITYAQAIFEAGQTYSVSPYHLASRIIQEVGTTGSEASSGTNETYPGIYNLYNIGANTGYVDGLKWAFNGGAAGSYGTPWTSPYKSIMGGAQFIAKGYINVGQDTLYFQKFDVIATGGLYNHQYMSNISAPYTESLKVYNTYKSMSLLNNTYIFEIPVYKNMPSTACALPDAALSLLPNLAADVTPVTNDTNVIYGGDVNSDGNFNILDVRQLLSFIAESVTLNETQLYEADVNHDGNVNIVDARTMLTAIANECVYSPRP